MKNLLLSILSRSWQGYFLPKLFSGFPFSVGTAGSLMAGSLLFCIFHASPRIPDAPPGSACSDTLWECALVFTPQRAARAPGWSSKENEHLVCTKQQDVASQQNTSAFCADPYICFVCATYTQHKRTDILCHPKRTGCKCLKENVWKCVPVFMNYLIFCTISICTSALNSKTACRVCRFNLHYGADEHCVYLSVPLPFRDKM